MLALQDTGQAIPEQLPNGSEVVMLTNDKLFVVLAVVLIIWLGILWFLYRTDRQIAELEDRIAATDPRAERPDSLGG